ncbi:mucin-22 [Vombatus ursinus]|uniref:mucin-22 n=1 Tax=Vombatus ursinus TaxID=29139 RepID=UPI000FFCE66F|nr:mucin-22 [Vombatus ursinus]
MKKGNLSPTSWTLLLILLGLLGLGFSMEMETTGFTSVSLTKPSSLLKPWSIIVISLAVTAMALGLCVGLSFCLNSPCSPSPFSRSPRGLS